MQTNGSQHLRCVFIVIGILSLVLGLVLLVLGLSNSKKEKDTVTQPPATPPAPKLQYRRLTLPAYTPRLGKVATLIMVAIFVLSGALMLWPGHQEPEVLRLSSEDRANVVKFAKGTEVPAFAPGNGFAMVEIGGDHRKLSAEDSTWLDESRKIDGKWTVTAGNGTMVIVRPESRGWWRFLFFFSIIAMTVQAWRFGWGEKVRGFRPRVRLPRRQTRPAAPAAPSSTSQKKTKVQSRKPANPRWMDS